MLGELLRRALSHHGVSEVVPFVDVDVVASMTVSDPTAVAALPVGSERFHRRRFINYQMNRAYGLGFADRDELHHAAARIRRREDCVTVFDELSRSAEATGRVRAATSYARLAEFFAPFDAAGRLPATGTTASCSTSASPATA